MSVFYERFGSLLRAERRAAHVTQADLADRLHINRTTVVNIEKGRQRVALHQLVQFADALGCAPETLLPEWDPNDQDIHYEALRDTEGAEFVSRVRASRREVK